MALAHTPSLALRQETADLHQQLDGASVMSVLMAAQVRLEDYVAVLHRLLRCHEWVEGQIKGWQRAQPASQCPYPHWLQPALYQRGMHLRLDLQALQAGTPDPAPALEDDEIVLSTPATVVGMVYVVAGSALGARVVERRVQASLGEAVAQATHFFRAGQAPEIPSWTTLRDCFDQALATPRDVQQAIWAARQTFACFVRWLTPPLQASAWHNGHGHAASQGR